MQVRPADQEVTLQPGDTVKCQVTVTNVGRLPFNVRMLAKPYRVKDESYDPDFTSEDSYTRLYKWISFSEENFALQSGESRNVEFTIQVPEDVPGGGQYAAIIAETRDSTDGGSAVHLITQLASLLYAHVAGEEHVDGKLLNQSLPSFLLGSPFSASVTVENDGNVDFRVKHSLTIRDFFTSREVFNETSTDANGNVVGMTNSIVFPETKRTNVITWTGAPQLGIFRAAQKISFLTNDYTEERIVIICPIWLAGAVGFIIVLIIIWVVLRIRNRRRNRPQVF